MMMSGMAIAAVAAHIKMRAMNQKSLFGMHLLLLVIFWATLENNQYQVMDVLVIIQRVLY